MRFVLTEGEICLRQGHGHWINVAEVITHLRSLSGIGRTALRIDKNPRHVTQRISCVFRIFLKNRRNWQLQIALQRKSERGKHVCHCTVVYSTIYLQALYIIWYMNCYIGSKYDDKTCFGKFTNQNNMHRVSHLTPDQIIYTKCWKIQKSRGTRWREVMVGYRKKFSIPNEGFVPSQKYTIIRP